MLAELVLQNELEPLLEEYEGKLLRCRGLETFEDEKGWGIRVDALTLIQGGQVIRTPPLRVYPVPGTRRLFLHWTAGALPLPGATRHLTVTTAAATLADEQAPAAPNRFELLRLRWHGERPVIDAHWWPDVARIGGDPRSLAAAGKLLQLFPTDGPERRWFAGRLADLSWEDLVPTLLRVIAGRLPARAARRAAKDESVAAFVTEFLPLCSADAGLPPELEGRSLAQVVQPESTRVAGTTTVYQFPSHPAALPEPYLAIIVETMAPVARARLCVGRGSCDRPVMTGAVSLIGAIDAQRAFRLELEDGQLLQAGLYTADAARQSGGRAGT